MKIPKKVYVVFDRAGAPQFVARTKQVALDGALTECGEQVVACIPETK